MFLDILKRSAKAGILCLALAGSLSAQSWKSYDCCSSDDCCESGWLSWDRLSIGAEALWWKATEDNLAYAEKTFFEEMFTETTVGSTTTANDLEITKTKKEEFDFKWKTGFRLNVDYLLPCNNWDLGFTWTHYVGRSSGSSRAPNQTETIGTTTTTISLTPGFLNQTVESVGEYDTIKSRWNLIFNNYEWDIGRTCCCTPCFAVRPYIGVKYLQIKQNLHINSNAKPYLISNGEETISQFDRQVLKSRFSGAGLQGGFDANWLLGCGFALYSNVSGGIAYGKVHAHRREFFQSHSVFIESSGETSINNDIDKFKDRDRTHLARPNLDFAIGLSWQHCLCECYVVTLRACWEYHHFFNQNFFRSPQAGNDLRGDLTLHGFTLGAGVQF